MLTLGCHLSTKEGYLFMAKEAVSIDANTFQYFTRNPRGGAAKKLDPKDIEAYRQYAAEHGIQTICGYAPYDVEPANPVGFDALAALTNNPRLQHVAFYLEEPHSTLVIYERDVQRFRAAYKG